MPHARWMTGCALLALAALALFVAFDHAGAEEGFKSQITWHADLAKARELASTSGKPLYVTFRCIP
ncbi:MAG: hypothetical protein QNJ98_10490 [Planctomycetota bacterium]|nr:hypothetical protein [Planctomycetota bacterium]